MELQLFLETPFGERIINGIKLTKEQTKELTEIFDSGGEVIEVFVNGYEA